MWLLCSLSLSGAEFEKKYLKIVECALEVDMSFKPVSYLFRLKIGLLLCYLIHL